MSLEKLQQEALLQQTPDHNFYRSSNSSKTPRGDDKHGGGNAEHYKNVSCRSWCKSHKNV